MHTGSSYAATLKAQAAEVNEKTDTAVPQKLFNKYHPKPKWKRNPPEHNHLRSTECYLVYSTKNGERGKILKQQEQKRERERRERRERNS